MEMAKQNKHKECSYYHSREVELFACPSSFVFVCHRSLFWMRNPKAAPRNFKHTVTQPRVVTEGLKVCLPSVFYNIMLQIKHLCPSETRLFGVCWFIESNWSLLVLAFACREREKGGRKEKKPSSTLNKGTNTQSWGQDPADVISHLVLQAVQGVIIWYLQTRTTNLKLDWSLLIVVGEEPRHA